MDYRIISIGAVSVHELWDRQGPARTAHATTTLIRSGDHRILVDPALPPQVLTARLAERAGLEPEDISDVFLTTFRPAHRMGLAAFPNARWLISEAEREAIGTSLVQRYQEQEGEDDPVRAMIQQDIAILKRFQAAPDKLAPHVDLFPLPGFTPGTCGLLLAFPGGSTVLIAGDAVPTQEHLERGRIMRGAYNVEQAQESFREVVEIADIIVPGHDNVLVNQTRRL